MTGFGVGTALLAGARITLELRSVNHKHQDLRLRLPPEFMEHISFLEQHARSTLGRGRYDLSVRLGGKTVSTIELDEEKLRRAYASVSALRDEIAPNATLEFSSLFNIPDLFRSIGPDTDDTRRALRSAFDDAAQQLEQMRLAEGRALKADLCSRLQNVQSLTADIQVEAPALVEHHRSRLRERIDALLDGTSNVAHDRLEQEVALVADRSDITEELVRLQSHFTQFGDFLEKDGEVGRRLDFLLQEVAREVNTIGSKCQHFTVSRAVVDLKSEVERLREQVQNVE